MIRNLDYDKSLEVLQKCQKVLITTHIRPDGDACGCVRALQIQLEKMGKDVRPLFLSPLAGWYQEMFPMPVQVLGNDISVNQLDTGYFDDRDLLIIVDTNSVVQLPGLEKYIEQSRNNRNIFVIDHHVTGDDLGTVQLLDTEAAAAGEIVFGLFKYANWEITKPIADALFIALSTDTGWFRFGNAGPKIFHIAAELISAGVHPDSIYKQMYQSFTPARLRLMVRMLEHLELHHNEQIATQYILRKDFDETGATGSDTENLIDQCQRIQSVIAAALLVELADGRFRCSLRSKGGVDVRKIAQKYGGGGHTLAAGVTLDGPVESALKTVVKEISAQLK